MIETMMIDKNVLRQLNKGIREYEKQGIEPPNAIRKYQEKLNDFYDKNHLRVKHGQFTTSDKLNMEQWDELSDIANAFIHDNDVKFLGDYEGILESGKFNKFKDIKNVDDLIDRMDKLQLEYNGVKILDVMSSDQIIEVFGFAKKHNISEDDMLKRIMKLHGKGERAIYGEDLQKKIYESYLGTEKPKKGKMGGVKKAGGKGNVSSVTIKSDKSNTGRRKAKKKRKS